jgi:tetratricopeptide (TPR) repeat protein
MPSEAEDRWRLIEDLFHRALELPTEERAARLDEWCGDRALRAEVDSLLEAASAAERVMAPGAADPWAGRMIGSFRLERLIGRGGMGAVYLGRRIAGDFEQQIAFKLASSRFTSPWLRQRFLEERQTLASLSHPNIAALLDGGLTEEGEPYLVMEYIDGLRLDHYCDRTGASVAEIVRLSLQLCDAVSFVHRHLVVHRDLKPANVLVTPEGRIKLLDFGAAKLLNPDSQARSEATRLGVRPLTPHYASPEQLLGEPTTAASDVYSLGVILYRLLTGRLPFEVEGDSSAEFAQAIAETAPVSPHAAITRPVLCEAAAHENDLSKRRAQIRGDLDAIVLKALRADQKERYASVDELAADLRSFLEHRPVKARQGSLVYRAAKLIRRHAMGFAASALIACALAAGVAVTVHEGRVAAIEESRARQGFREVRRLANLLLFDFYDQVKQLQGSTDVQRRLVTQALRYLDGLARDAAGDPEVQLDLVEAYTKMGNVLGNPYEQNLGDATNAVVSLEKAVALAGELHRLRPKDPLVARRLSMARISLGEVHFSPGNTARAIEYSRSAAETLGELAARPGAAVREIQEAASAFDSLGDLHGLRRSASVGNLDAARESYRRSLTLHQRALNLEPGNVRSQRGIAILRMKIANTQFETEPAAATQGYAAALAALDQLPEEARKAMPTPRIAAVIRHKLGTLYGDIARPREAIPQLVFARDLFASIAARDPDDSRARFDLATVEVDLGHVRQTLGERAAAREHFRSVLRILDGLLQRSPSNPVWLGHRAETLYRIGQLDRALGETARGDRAVREALALALPLAEGPDASTADLDRAAGILLEVEPAALRQPQKALEYAARAVEKSRGANPDLLLTLAKAEQTCGRAREACATLARLFALLPAPARGQPATDVRRSAEGLLGALRCR